MNKKLTECLWISSLLLSGYLLNIFIVSEFFVGMLERNRISIYYVKDCVLIFYGVLIFGSLIYLIYISISKRNSKNINYNVVFYLLGIVLIIRFLLAHYYPNVPRSDIGYFYIIPEGQTITYPKYPRGKNIN